MAHRKTTSGSGDPNRSDRKAAAKSGRNTKPAKGAKNSVVKADAAPAGAHVEPVIAPTAPAPSTPVMASVPVEAAVTAATPVASAAPVAPVAPVAPATSPREQMEVKSVDGDVQALIRRQAFQIWCERGGDPVANWLEAERRVMSVR